MRMKKKKQGNISLTLAFLPPSLPHRFLALSQLYSLQIPSCAWTLSNSMGSDASKPQQGTKLSHTPPPGGDAKKKQQQVCCKSFRPFW